MLNKLREKVLLLLEEAWKDAHTKCYNKAFGEISPRLPFAGIANNFFLQFVVIR